MMPDFEPVQEAIAAGQTELARNLLRILIEDYPDDAAVWYYAAQAAVNDTQRKAFLEKAVNLDPLHHQAANELYSIQNGSREAPLAEPDPVTIKPPAIIATPLNMLFARRAVALIIDFMVLLVFAIPLAVIIVLIREPDLAITGAKISDNPSLSITIFLFMTLLQCIYYGLFLTQNNGQTIGKWILGIRVVKRDGSKLTIWDALLRNVIGYQVSNLLPGIGFLWMFIDGQSRTWHDMMAGTMVVRA